MREQVEEFDGTAEVVVPTTFATTGEGEGVDVW